MGRVGSCFDNAAAVALFSTLEWELLSRDTKNEAVPVRVDPLAPKRAA